MKFFSSTIFLGIFTLLSLSNCSRDFWIGVGQIMAKQPVKQNQSKKYEPNDNSYKSQVKQKTKKVPLSSIKSFNQVYVNGKKFHASSTCPKAEWGGEYCLLRDVEDYFFPCNICIDVNE